MKAWRAIMLGLVLAGAAHRDDGVKVWSDPRWDATPRRTDATNSAPLNPASRLPDLLRASLTAWQSPTASTDPYNGSVVDTPGQAHLFRLDVVFDGLVNPPGRLGDDTVSSYEPFRYGNSPVYGFLEIDVDADLDTGGELGTAAKSRYLANVCRFGRLPAGAIGQRAAVWGDDLNQAFGQSPNYRASGTDFLLSLCGCFDPTIVSEGGNGNHIFEAGETWVIRGAFFQRSGGYRESSVCFGGSSGVPGMYDPLVNLRFSHSTATNQTTISLVYALDMVGAGLLAGQAPQAMDHIVSNQTSIQEGIQDLIDSYPLIHPSGDPLTLFQHWLDPDHADLTPFLNPVNWNICALFGTASATPQEPGTNYIWTDTGFLETAGDVNGDGVENGADRALVRQSIIQYDAGPRDDEGPYLDNGQVKIIGFGANFCLYDVTGDGYINNTDLNSFCIADFDGDGRLTINDFSAFLNAFLVADPRADLNHNGILELNDLIAFGNAFSAGCPYP